MKRLALLGMLLAACQLATAPPASVASKTLPARPESRPIEQGPLRLEVAPTSAAAELDGTRPPPADEERVVSVVAALWSSCALLESGSVWCWGVARTTDSSVETDAVRQVPLVHVTKLIGAGSRFFALGGEGKLFAWGEHPLGGRGPADSAEPIAVPLGPVLDVAASSNRVCALARGGRVTCWERGNSWLAAELPDARRIAVSSSMTCAQLEDGQVSCFGEGSTPSLRPGLSDVIELVAAGPQHCALRRGGSVSCWPQAPQAGFESNVEHLSASPRTICAFKAAGLPVCSPLASESDRDELVSLPEQVFPRAARMSEVSIGAQHGCAVLEGRAWCWGEAVFNQLGPAGEAWQAKQYEKPPSDKPSAGDDSHVLARVALGDTAALAHVIDVGLATDHRCVVTTAGTLRCWGDNQWGQLGIAADQPAFGVVHATALSNVLRVFASDGVSCALLNGGDLYCWGREPWRNDLAICRVDDDQAAPCSEKPVRVASQVLQVGLGTDFGCLLDRERRVRCWGNNELGQLGTGDTKPRASPEPVLADDGKPLVSARELRVFASHACAIDDSGKLWCWGDNAPLTQGRRYNSAPKLLLASALPALPKLRDVSERCILTQEAELRCWGDVFEDPHRFSYEPVRIGLCGVTQLVAGGPGRCFVDRNGLNCLDLQVFEDNGWKRALLRIEHPGPHSAAAGSQVCTIDAQGGLGCVLFSGDNHLPSIGSISSRLSTVDATTPNCPRDAAPRTLPSFPPLPAASVRVSPSSVSSSSDSPSKHRALGGSRQLSADQVARVLRLLNDRANYTNQVTCHDALFEITFHDAHGEVQAEVSVGDCDTLESAPEIPAQHGHGNIVRARLNSGLFQICREAGLPVCIERSNHHASPAIAPL